MSTVEISISHLHDHHCLSVVQTTPALSLDIFVSSYLSLALSSDSKHARQSAFQCYICVMKALVTCQLPHPSNPSIRQSVNTFETSPSPNSVLYIRIVSEHRNAQAIMFFFRHTCRIIDELHAASRGWTRINPDVHTDMAPAARLSSIHPCNYIDWLWSIVDSRSTWPTSNKVRFTHENTE